MSTNNGSIKNVWHEAAIQTHDLLDGLVQQWRGDQSQITGDEALARYVMLHKSNPLSLQEYVARHIAAGHVPAGVNPLQAMRDYEAAMEAELKKRKGGRP
jgi:hypothetical protein